MRLIREGEGMVKREGWSLTLGNTQGWRGCCGSRWFVGSSSPGIRSTGQELYNTIQALKLNTKIKWSKYIYPVPIFRILNTLALSNPPVFVICTLRQQKQS